MSNSDQAANPGARAVEENLAGTRDEFNDAVTSQMLRDAAKDSADAASGPDTGSGSDDEPSAGDTERDSQPALETDEDSPASEGKASS